MPGYSFEIFDGPDQGKSYELQVGTTLIGRRDTPADDDPPGSRRWILTDPAVSRTHARIDWDGSKPPVLLHLSSTNATLLEGRIVTGQSIEDGQSLSDGHQLRMGQTGIVVRVEQDSGKWVIEDQSEQTEVPLSEGDTMEKGGVVVTCRGSSADVALSGEEVEAYLLRMIEGQYWTTPLKPNKPLSLQGSDVIRTETIKLVVVSEGTA